MGIADQLADASVNGDHLTGAGRKPSRMANRNPSPWAASTEDDSSSRQADEKTNRLPLPGAVFTAPQTNDPAERLRYCRGAISAAQEATGAALAKVERQWILWVGEPLRIIRDEDLWQLDGHATFDAFCRVEHDFSGDYANKQIRAMPVVRILAPLTNRPLKEATVRPLSAVLSAHGEQAVRAVWKEAQANGDVTERGVKEAARKLGYAVAEAGTQISVPRQPSGPAANLIKVSSKLEKEVAKDAAKLRQQIHGDPDALFAARRMHALLSVVLAED